MSTVSTDTEASAAVRRKRSGAQTLVIGLSIAIAVGTLGSGLSSWFWERHDDSPVTREVFGGISPALYWAFYVITPVLIIIGAFLFAARTRNWERGKPDNRATTAANFKRRFTDFRAGVY